MDTLHILWTSRDKEVFLNMVGMYALNSKRLGWWKNVDLIIWGPSVQLATTDNQIQTELLEMKQAGVHIRACKDCADNYNASAKLEKLGVLVIYMGEPLTEILKSDKKLLTF